MIRFKIKTTIELELEFGENWVKEICPDLPDDKVTDFMKLISSYDGKEWNDSVNQTHIGYHINPSLFISDKNSLEEIYPKL